MQRDAIIDLMNDPIAQELVTAPIHARLAYSARDGSPRVIPIGYLWNGEVFVMGSPVNAPKVKALAANPKVALTVDTDSFRHTSCSCGARRPWRWSLAKVFDFETRLPGPVEELIKGNAD